MIAEPYLLVLNIPLHRREDEYWADPLWKQDLEAHLAQIADLSLACPVLTGPMPDGWEKLSIPGVTVHPLPAMGRWSLLALPWLIVRVWRAISHAAIVHAGVAGWPFPLGWIAIPIARWRRRFVVLVVESAFWRIPPGTDASAPARARAWFWERVNRAMVRRCDLVFFTSEGYRDTLHGGVGKGDGGRTHVLPAVWVSEEQLIDPERLAATGAARGGRLLFAGRLTEAKGVDLLLDAVVRSGVAVDVVGSGPLRDRVLAAHRAHPDLVRLIEPVDYGDAFSVLLDGYAALVVPTLSDEQPRIIFDAFARGIPVLASDTPGNRQVVDHDRTGLLYRSGDVGALADTLVAATRDPARLRAMGATARAAAASRTHASMHAERAQAIAQAFADR